MRYVKGREEYSSGKPEIAIGVQLAKLAIYTQRNVLSSLGINES